MKLSLLSTIVVPATAWIHHKHQIRLAMPLLAMGEKDTTPSTESYVEEAPCWQDLYDEDCSMDKAYAATFVAADWIKTMPCAEGVEDCDMPQELTTPHNRPEAEDSDVDVMEFLGLVRTESLKTHHDEDDNPTTLKP